jgi:hypothetical protein
MYELRVINPVRNFPSLESFSLGAVGLILHCVARPYRECFGSILLGRGLTRVIDCPCKAVRSGSRSYESSVYVHFRR